MDSLMQHTGYNHQHLSVSLDWTTWHSTNTVIIININIICNWNNGLNDTEHRSLSDIKYVSLIILYLIT